jgi:hypothetical protein
MIGSFLIYLGCVTAACIIVVVAIERLCSWWENRLPHHVRKLQGVVSQLQSQGLRAEMISDHSVWGGLLMTGDNTTRQYVGQGAFKLRCNGGVYRVEIRKVDGTDASLTFRKLQEAVSFIVSSQPARSPQSISE